MGGGDTVVFRVKVPSMSPTIVIELWCLSCPHWPLSHVVTPTVGEGGFSTGAEKNAEYRFFAAIVPVVALPPGTSLTAQFSAQTGAGKYVPQMKPFTELSKPAGRYERAGHALR